MENTAFENLMIPILRRVSFGRCCYFRLPGHIHSSEHLDQVYGLNIDSSQPPTNECHLRQSSQHNM
jgi:hypothetical protein